MINYKSIRFFSKLVSPALLLLMVLSIAQPALALTKPVNLAAKAGPATDQSTVVVKVKAEADLNLSGETFTGKDKRGADQLNKVLGNGKTKHKQRLIANDKQTIKSHRNKLDTSLQSNQGNLEDYYTVQLASGQKADDVANQLKQIDSVATAYAKPLPAPAPITGNYAPYQSYFKAAPNGMGINATIGGSATTRAYPGTDGSKVKVGDLEYSWNTNHEDLSKLRASGALWANGTPSDPYNDKNHGTAVGGVISGDRNGIGVDGIVANTDYHMVNVYNTERGWDVANAIYLATSKMAKGDVILLEQQAWAPDYEGFAPIEIYQDVYDAISAATAKGITVIEPAGNGKQNFWQGYNLNDPLFGNIFTTARVNSGAIMVGAGGGGCSTTPARARMAYSNYGSRINVQGMGECFITTGYGDFGGTTATSANTTYTSGFGGTSSASAMIAGVSAELSSSYKQSNWLVAMSPSALKAALVKGGSAQNTSYNAGTIGALPNMASALRLTDITKPGAPVLTAKATAIKRNTLTWTAATDNLGYIGHYYVYRNNVKIATLSGTVKTYNDTSVSSKVSYTYRVVADDASGNLSANSNNVSVLTQ